MVAIDKTGRGFVCVRPGPDEQLAVRGQCASWVGTRGIAGQRKSLAPAAAPVDLAPLAGPARVRHPIRPPEPLERRRTIPDVAQARSAYGPKNQAAPRL